MVIADPKKHYVRKHTDDDDIAPQYAMVLGDCTGGELKALCPVSPWDLALRACPGSVARATTSNMIAAI
eukprot:COSAG02_NODE_848_length_16553_cov_21.228577_13_plen_69_part_00